MPPPTQLFSENNFVSLLSFFRPLERGEHVPTPSSLQKQQFFATFSFGVNAFSNTYSVLVDHRKENLYFVRSLLKKGRDTEIPFDSLLLLGKGKASKTDEFSEKFQTAVDPPPSFLENHVADFL